MQTILSLEIIIDLPIGFPINNITTSLSVILKGSAEQKRKLKAAFGFVTPGGELFEGLMSANAAPLTTPLLQILL